MNSSLTSKKLLSQPAYNLGPSWPNFYHCYKARAGPALGFGPVWCCETVAAEFQSPQESP